MNDHTLNPLDDPKLTAYALGELGAQEAAEVEKRIADDEALCAEVEAIKRAAQQLRDELGTQPRLALTDSQRTAIRDRAVSSAEHRQRPTFLTSRKFWIGSGLAIAASWVIAMGLPMLGKSRESVQTASVMPEYEVDRLAVTANAPLATPSIAPLGNMVNGDERSLTGGSVALFDRIVQSPAGNVMAGWPEAPRGNSPHIPGKRRSSLSHDTLGSAGQDRNSHPFLSARIDVVPFTNWRDDNGNFDREAYARIVDNPFMRVGEQPLSTFSIDVDTAAYANMRRFLTKGSLPPPDAVRIEELINYFNYDYAAPSEADEQPFATHVEIADCPWNTTHRLARIGIKGREVDIDMRPATNLVFLLDVSGSMNQPNKLPLVKRSMRLLLDHLTVDDRVAIVVYAGASGLVLPSTYCSEKQVIIDAIDRLHAGGSTNGGAGIELAYNTAAQSFIEGGVNRVILCTDGDFNIGVTAEGELVRLIEEKRKGNIFLSVLGFGTGNWQDDRMEQLSNHGNGNFAYIDSLREANKVLVEEMGGTLVTIAKDVKIQIEFNPAVVGAYRLIGYENRVLAAQDFNDDTKDAGEIGAGHTVTALYEIVPAGLADELPDKPAVDELKYQAQLPPSEAASTGEMMTLKLRYKEPEGEVSKLLEYPVTDGGGTLNEATGDFKFAAAVASFGMILRGSPHKGDATYQSVLDLAEAGSGDRNDSPGDRDPRGPGVHLDRREATKILDDFIHYTLIAKPELAVANVRALLDSDLTDAELAALANADRKLVERMTRAFTIAALIPDLVEPTQELAKRIERGEAEPRTGQAGSSYRAEFVELVKRAASMSAK